MRDLPILTGWLPRPRAARMGLVAAVSLTLLARCGSDREPPQEPLRRQSLLLELHGFEPAEGVPNQSPRFLSLHQDPHRPEAAGALRLLAPPTGELRGPPVKLPTVASLEVGLGVEVLDPLALDEAVLVELARLPPVSIRFEVHWSATGQPDRPHSLADVTLELTASPSRTRVRRDLVIPLHSVASREGRLLFRTTRLDTGTDLRVLPAWWSPTLIGGGEAREPGAGRRVERVLVDLLQLEAAPATASPADHTLRTPVPRNDRDAVVGVEAHFEAGAGLHVPRGGTRPALSFAASATRWFEVSPSGDARHAELRFEAAFQSPAEPVPGLHAEVRVLCGDEVRQRFEVQTTVSPGSWGWSETFTVPLPEACGSGEGVRLGLQVSVGAPEAGTKSPPLGLSRPRIVEVREVGPVSATVAAPSVLFLCVETWRADEVDWVGGGNSPTPELARWSSRGRIFRRAYSPSSWTLPSAASYLTGLDPWAHGAVSELRELLPDHIETLAEAAHWQGLRTAAIVTNALLRAETGFAAGFETHVLANAATADQVNRAFLDWHSLQPGARFLAYLHYFDPHAPACAPGEFAGAFVTDTAAGTSGADTAELEQRVKRAMRESLDASREPEALAALRQRYRGEVAYLDHCLGALLDELQARGALEHTLVILTSDHGEEFGEHRWFGHGSQVYEETVRVPLAMWGAGVEPGVVDQPVESLQAVLRAAATLGLGKWLDGRTATRPPLDLRHSDTGREVLYLATDKGIDLTSEPQGVALLDHPERLTPRPLRALLVGEQKAVLRLSRLPEHATREALAPLVERLELYDLSTDPDERRPRVVEFEAAPRALQERLLQQLQLELQGVRALPTAEAAPSTLEVLQELGYVAAGAGR